MTRLLLLFLAFLIPTAVHAQAMRPAPAASGPLITQPPPPGQPTYTPAGAGASHGGLATPAAAVPRSPNKRPLPPSRGVGLWAADGTPVASSGLGVTVLGVHFALDLDLKPARAAHECAKAVNDANDNTSGWVGYVARMSEATRQCIAAQALSRCAASVRDELQSGTRTVADFRAEHAAAAAEAAAHWGKVRCDGVELERAQEEYLAWLNGRVASLRPRR